MEWRREEMRGREEREEVWENSPWAGGKVGINLVAKVEWYHFVPYINTK